MKVSWTAVRIVTGLPAMPSTSFVPPPFGADSIMEAADAGIRTCVAITDGIPAQDMMMVKRYLFRFPKERRSTLIGPNCAGIISAGKAMLGIMPGHIYSRGKVGLVTRSGTLGYEAAALLDLVAVGGGGLIGGIAAWYSNRIRIVGVEPEAAPTLRNALRAGHPVDSPAGGIAADSLAPRRVGSRAPILRSAFPPSR